MHQASDVSEASQTSTALVATEFPSMGDSGLPALTLSFMCPFSSAGSKAAMSPESNFSLARQNSQVQIMSKGTYRGSVPKAEGGGGVFVYGGGGRS